MSTFKYELSYLNDIVMATYSAFLIQNEHFMIEICYISHALSDYL